MKRKILPIVIALLLTFTLSEQVLAYDIVNDNEYIRVALNSILKAESNYVSSLSSDGFQLGTFEKGFNSLFEINVKKLYARVDGYYMDTYGSMLKTSEINKATYGPIHIKTNKTYYFFEDAFNEVEQLRNLNINAFIYYNQRTFEIWVGQYIDEVTANKDAVKYLEYLGNNIEIVNNNNRIMLSNEYNEILLMFDKSQNIYLSSLNSKSESVINVESNSYRDYITFSRSGDELVLINIVKLKNYLYGVVPKETYPSWPLEALKAQAVAARNFALVNNKHVNEGYDLCDTTHCQVYGGYKSETIMTNRAVDETADRVLMYNDEIVNAYYHSSSGGHTENSENVWSGKVPYLRGVIDDYSLGSPYDSWQFVISDEEMRTKLIENGLDVGYITDISVMSTSESGRVLELMIRGTMGTQILKKEKARQVFGTNNIKSTLYEVYFGEANSNGSLTQEIFVFNTNSGSIEKQNIGNMTVLSLEGLKSIDPSLLSNGIAITDGTVKRELRDKMVQGSSNSDGKIVFSGKGWGHGVGMSQWGAKKMAELGYSYEEILEYYYNGAKVK